MTTAVNSIPPISPPPGPAPSRRFWSGIVLMLAVAFFNFWIQTRPVRLATADDVEFQTVADRGDTKAYLAAIARDQGRFLYCTPIYRFALFSPYKVRAAWAFSLLRAAALFLQVCLVAGLAARVARSGAFGAAVALLLMGTLHLPLTFYLVLSVPPVWIGFSAILGACHCHCTHLRQPRWWSGLLTGVLFLLAVLMHDVFVIFLPLFPALAWLEGERTLSRLLRLNLLPAVVALAYVGVHRSFALEFPSLYAGTRFSLDLAVATKVLFRQMIGVVPGFELIVNRVPYETPGPLLRELPAMMETLRLLTAPDVLLASGTALAMAAACRQVLREPLPRARLWPWAVGFAALANVPIALSLKYQVFILHREFPYGYAWFSYCFLGIAAVGAVIWLGQSVLAEKSRLLLAGATGVAVFLLCLSALASNHRVLQILRERYN